MKTIVQDELERDRDLLLRYCPHIQLFKNYPRGERALLLSIRQIINIADCQRLYEYD